ncbi:serine hydrolase domain-containing protein [Kribbella sp. WER1]
MDFSGLSDLLEEHRLPGMAVGVCTADEVLWSGGFGVTRAGGDVPVGTETMFSVQSCSKMYTATAVLHAVRDGLVEVDEPIVRYLPEFRVRSPFEEHPERRMTLRHLLSHTAGFTHEAPVGSNYLVGRESFEAHCRSISQTWLRFPVGRHFQYSNLGIDLAGYVLQRRSGLPFHEYVRRVLLEPLGLERTSFDARVIARAPDRAIGHSTGYSRLPVRVPMVAAGGLYTTVSDACRFMQFHLMHGESLAAMYPQHGYGLGIALTKANGIPTLGHGGGGFGFLSDMSWGAGVGVVVLTNSTAHSLQRKVATDIFREVVGEGPPPSRPTRSVAPDPSLAGRYDQATLVVDGEDAFLVEGDEPKPAVFVGAREFWVDGETFRVHDEYLESVEGGGVRYRNDVPEPSPAPVDGPWNRDYAIHVSGVRDGTARLRKEDGVHVFDHWGGGTYRLREYRPGLYLSSNGEMLDLTSTPPTYANVRLHDLSDPGA